MNHISRYSACLILMLVGLLLSSCKWNRPVCYGRDIAPRAVVKDGVAITLCDQKLTLFKAGKKVKEYPISSSKFGIGAQHGSNRTPLGIHAVSDKKGSGLRKGAVMKSCRPTGEIVSVNAAGRDPIVTRVIQLAGLETFNRNSHSRRIYIHGTPEEYRIGQPVSYGCIRMKSDDVIDLFNRVERGVPVAIESCTQKTYMAVAANPKTNIIKIPDSVVASLPKDGQYRKTYRKRYSRKAKYSRRSRIAKRGRAYRGRGTARRGRALKTRRLASRGLRKRRR